MNPTTVWDFYATVLHLLGLNHERLTWYHNGLDRRLTDVHGRVEPQARSWSGSRPLGGLATLAIILRLAAEGALVDTALLGARKRQPHVLQLEHRFRASVLLAGGLPTGPRPTETDPLNFASRSSGKPWTGWTATWGPLNE